MKNILRNAVQQRRQILIDKLLKIGVFKKEDKHLYEWTLSDLEKEYQYIATNGYHTNEGNTDKNKTIYENINQDVYT